VTATVIELRLFEQAKTEPTRVRGIPNGIAFVRCAECGAPADLARVHTPWQQPFCDIHAPLQAIRGAA
jgi:hypothetical protein